MPVLQPYIFKGKQGACLRLADFASQHIRTRHVDIWHPLDYDTSPTKYYPVIYMHDGQNLFDPALSYIGVDWGVDQAINQLKYTRGVVGAIVVGIWNSPLRYLEYMPQHPFERSADQPEAVRFVKERGGTPISDAYLRCLVEEIKPFVDENFRTLPGPDSTFVMGSSMGGLLSLYAISSYPQIFGGAACLSTHWTIGGEALVAEMGKSLPAPANHRLYFDFGTKQQDAHYQPYQTRMDQYGVAAGYQQDKNWKTVRWEGHEHSERAWRSRLDVPLKHLLCP
jgi:predicted alpha/beta superfamily hydrolase